MVKIPSRQFRTPLNTMGSDPMVKSFFALCSATAAAAADTRHETSQQSHSPFLSPLTFSICWQSQHSTANSPPRITSHPLNHPTQRPRLIVPANTSISIIPPTTPHTPNSLFSAAAHTHRQFLHPLSPINQLMQHQLASR